MVKRVLIVVLSFLVLAVLFIFGMFRASLPTLDDEINAPVSVKATLSRDEMGIAVINASSKIDAAFILGYAHAQDRLFQMDLLRRSSAGEISELFGEAALTLDKRSRFHQFRQRAQNILATMPEQHKQLLASYTKGVNLAVKNTSILPFEYLFLNAEFKPWLPEDSILTALSMYMDLQHRQVIRDLVLTRIAHKYGQSMLDFLLMPSEYQAALDGSIIPPPSNTDIPDLASNGNTDWASVNISEPIDIGSNNWAVSGAVTKTGQAMLSDDMHLGLRVPPIWYRASLNYLVGKQDVRMNGVSLPGVPGIIVGSNGQIAWGFTNSNLDNTDWIELSVDAPVTKETEVIMVRQTKHVYSFDMSEFGPVKQFGDKRYALKWVAHYPYAVNMELTELDTVTSVADAKKVAHRMGIAVQNMVIADNQGNIAWTPGGAVTARKSPSNKAIQQADVSSLWAIQEPMLPDYTNPDNHRIWTANSRVISTEQLSRYGDGGYALGARGLQIRDRLFEYETFEETDFYTIQLDNEARFLAKWHVELTTALQINKQEFNDDLQLLENWQACACPDSAGYSLVRRFRSSVINQLLAPLENHLKSEQLSLRAIMGHVEPAISEILKQRPLEWLPEGSDNWDQFLIQSYRFTRQEMLDQYVELDANASLENLQKLRWGTVNELKVQHPFSRIFPWLSGFLDMPTVDGFGDSFMPAVQNGSHGASQRFIVQPGNEGSAILTVPGGQSSHPLSDFYRKGFEDYTQNARTPLLPKQAIHTIVMRPE